MWVTSGLSCSPSEIVDLLCSTNGQGRGAGWTVGSGLNGHAPFSIYVDTAVGITSVAGKEYRGASSRCFVPEGQERYIYQHARVELWLRWHCYYLVCVGCGSRCHDGWWFCDMNIKYLLRYLHSYFAADRACTVVRWVIAGVVHSDTAVCDDWDNSSRNGRTLTSRVTGRR